MLLADGFYRVPRLATMRGETHPLDDAGLLVHNGRFERVGAFHDMTPYASAAQELPDALYGPAFINAHCHLELSFLHGQAPRGLGFEGWVGWLIQQKPAGQDHVEDALDMALDQAKASDTAYIADITSRAVERVAAALERHGLYAQLFYEYFGFASPPDTAFALPARLQKITEQYPSLRLSPAGHALYSTHPETLRRAKAFANAAGIPFSLHLAEHPGELEMLATGNGVFADMLRVRVLPKDFIPPKMTPVAYADSLGLLDANTLVVHAVHVDKTDIVTLKQRGVTVCLCPRSNTYIGVGKAPVARYLDHDIPICLGTDSLASNDDLNLKNEREALQTLAGRELSPQQSFQIMATTPARLLAPDMGTIAEGHIAALATL